MIDLINEVKSRLEKKIGSSDKIIVRIGLSNKGFQDGVVGAEATLEAEDLHFRLPLHTGYRPWETDGNASPQSYIIIKSRGLQVLDFAVDENMNARNDIEKLRESLNRGVNATVSIFGTEKHCVARRSFNATLPQNV